MNTVRIEYLSFILIPIYWILWVITVVYYSCAITYDSVSHKIQSILSKKKETSYEDLENKIIDDDRILHMFKQAYVFCNMYEGLSFRDKPRIKIGAMTMPQVSVNEEIENLSVHEFVIKWKEFVEK